MCSKIGYDDYAADRELENIRIKREFFGHTHRKECDKYLCEDCGMYHLTSHTYKRQYVWVKGA